MRSADERCSAVRNRARKLRRRRDGRAVAAVAALALFSLVDLAGRTASSGGSGLSLSSPEALFGASSLFGPSAGGYILVALAAAVVAVAVTVLCMRGRRSKTDDDEGAATGGFPGAASGIPVEADKVEGPGPFSGGGEKRP